jgi:hypothetical protein
MHAAAAQAGGAVTHGGALEASAAVASRCPLATATIATFALPRSTFEASKWNTCSIRLKQMKHLKHAYIAITICATPDLLLQHLDKTFATYV